RELMELHTLGIDGGYTQRDVQELARALTGWTVHEDGLNAGAFTFNEAVHDATEKTVIGHTIPAGSGEAGIREMLDILATHPETARFISYKLVRRFVADNPPADLVEQLAATFLRTGGDIKTILREMFLSEAFATAPDKLKQPMSYVASMLRGLSADVGPQGFRQLYTILDRMGHLPFGWPMPDGYPDVTGAWLGTLLPRWNLALAALNGEIEGINVPAQQFIGMSGGTDNVPATLDAVAVQLLGTTLPSQTRSALLRYLAEGPGGQLKRVQQTMALILAGPAFQWM
ncbi:MAG: DUF1800 domain-containing protein, partial [Chloroflexi bacterium]|nr:DUF1800 domain-containing protein [Chloroflexota bacterium]